jgi:ribonuclease HIII
MKKSLQKVVTLTLPLSKVEKIKLFYQDHQLDNQSAYVNFFAKIDQCTIIVYTSKNSLYKVVFQGELAVQESQLWQSISVSNQGLGDHYGSDEVGTGDFFGPVVVSAAFVRQQDFATLQSLGVQDSKQLTDAVMMTMVKTLKRYIPHVTTMVNPLKYAKLIEQGMNLNTIKARLHHHALLTLRKKVNITAPMIIDQFASEKKIDEYLFNLPAIPNRVLLEKAESQSLAVAAASIFARVRFIEAMHELGKPFQVTLPFGASIQVEKFAYLFAKKHGIETLQTITKSNFITLQRIRQKLSS